MRIWVDADACPQPIREILFRAAARARVVTTFVANRAVRVPSSPYLAALRVGHGFDVADRTIAERAGPGDLVVTADIPLAAAVVGRGAVALDPRGTLYTEENVAERLAVRNLMDQLRSEGVATGGPATFGTADRQAFAAALDRLLSRTEKGGRGGDIGV